MTLIVVVNKQLLCSFTVDYFHSFINKYVDLVTTTPINNELKFIVVYKGTKEYWMFIPASGPWTHVNMHWLGGPPGPPTSPGPVRSHIPHVRLSGTGHTVLLFNTRNKLTNAVNNIQVYQKSITSQDGIYQDGIKVNTCTKVG